MSTASTDFLSCGGAELAYLATRRKDLAALKAVMAKAGVS